MLLIKENSFEHLNMSTVLCITGSNESIIIICFKDFLLVSNKYFLTNFLLLFFSKMIIILIRFIPFSFIV